MTVLHPDPVDAALASATAWRPVVSSTLGDEVLADEVPVISGSVTASTGMKTLSQVSLTVARFVDGFDWCPGSDPAHPLARYGQTLAVAVQFEAVDGSSVDQRVGTFKVHEWDADDDQVQVTGLSMLKGLEERRFTVPQAPRTDGTLLSEAERLVRGIVPVVFDGGLVDRAVPKAMSWGDERLDALLEIADAWPARVRVDQFGVMWFLPPLGQVAVPTRTLTDGEGGTVVGTSRADSREGVPNLVIASGTDMDKSDRPSVWATAVTTNGPMAYGGDYGVVTHHFSSPLLKTTDQCEKAARTRLDNLSRPSRSIPVMAAADPRIELDETVEVIREVDGTREWGWVTGYELPLVHDGGSMRLDVGVSA